MSQQTKLGKPILFCQFNKYQQMYSYGMTLNNNQVENSKR